MNTNPITEEIREIRHRLAEQQGNDVQRIGAELRHQQTTSSRRYVQLPPRKPKVILKDNQIQTTPE